MLAHLLMLRNGRCGEQTASDGAVSLAGTEQGRSRCQGTLQAHVNTHTHLCDTKSLETWLFLGLATCEEQTCCCRTDLHRVLKEDYGVFQPTSYFLNFQGLKLDKDLVSF